MKRELFNSNPCTIKNFFFRIIHISRMVLCQDFAPHFKGIRFSSIFALLVRQIKLQIYAIANNQLYYIVPSFKAKTSVPQYNLLWVSKRKRKLIISLWHDSLIRHSWPWSLFLKLEVVLVTVFQYMIQAFVTTSHSGIRAIVIFCSFTQHLRRRR